MKFESMELDDNDAFWDDLLATKTAKVSSPAQSSHSANCFFGLDEEPTLVNISGDSKPEQDKLASPFDLPPEGERFEDHMLTQLEGEPRLSARPKDSSAKVISAEEWSKDKTSLLSLLASIEQLGLGLSFPLESLIGTNAELDKRYKVAQR